MSLIKGPGSIRKNVDELMNNVESDKRDRAIKTIMQKHNITYQEAQYRQAIRIAQKQARKI